MPTIDGIAKVCHPSDPDMWQNFVLFFNIKIIQYQLEQPTQMSFVIQTNLMTIKKVEYTDS